jgi:hypothetical protein
MKLASIFSLIVLLQLPRTVLGDESFCGNIAASQLISEYHNWSDTRTTLTISVPERFQRAKFSAMRATLGSEDGSTFDIAARLRGGRRFAEFQLPKDHERLQVSVYFDEGNCFRLLEVEFQHGSRTTR